MPRFVDRDAFLARILLARSKEFTQCGAALAIIQGRTSRSRHDHHMKVGVQRVTMGPVDLPKIALDAIAHHRLSHFARDGEAELAALAFAPKGVANEVPPRALFAFPVQRKIVASPRNAFTSRIGLRGTHTRAFPPSGRQTLATLRPAALDDQPATRRCHANQESMVALALENRRLIRAFHETLLTVFGLLNGGWNPTYPHSPSRAMPIARFRLQRCLPCTFAVLGVHGDQG